MAGARKIAFIFNPAGPELEALVRDKFAGAAEFLMPEEAVERIQEFSALMTMDRKLPDGLLSRAKALEWVHIQSHGFYKVLTPELRAHPATVTNARGAHPESVSEHIFAMLLALMRHLRDYTRLQQEHRWERITMDTLYEKTLCIIGVGNIGSAVARRAKGFGMRVIGVDIAPVVCESVDELVGPREMDAAIARSDVVAVCVPYNDDTAGMFCRRRMQMLKHGAYLVNIARGGIVDEVTLREMLDERRIAGAGFDVFETEPLPADSPLWDAPNLVLLPHTASQTELSRRRLKEIAVENIRRYLAGEPLLNVVKRGTVP
ncbi:MAG: D-2-hydroxyacid dehydrogenase [Bacillota bacterium]|nr:D-2-hydroxyacid dehydrogenase [Bacillota bacterium]